ncbi:hypothetical protein COCVIDRAFT_93861 [Bipolaris victoriae FI3]|uniref:Uncharacterized protein n=1 Tax=Bipolaris victoriae (strain FI3) TaxID=930091 RepID=W7ESP2_BIPV3|nr:hypothetical protein COCVIDRAFT_93861 [Bipolaris victoriae FI3]
MARARPGGSAFHPGRTTSTRSEQPPSVASLSACLPAAARPVAHPLAAALPHPPSASALYSLLVPPWKRRTSSRGSAS